MVFKLIFELILCFFLKPGLFLWKNLFWRNHGVLVTIRARKGSNALLLDCTFLESDVTDVTVIIPFPAAELKHVDRHSGSDLLLGQTHAVVENLEEPLGLLLLVQLVVEGVLSGRRNN